MRRCEVKVTREPLLPLPSVFSTEHGAVVDFFGVVRENENDVTISGLEYEAFVEMAEAELGRISEEMAQKFSLGSVIVHHRIGFCPQAGQCLPRLKGRSHATSAFGIRLKSTCGTNRPAVTRHAPVALYQDENSLPGTFHFCPLRRPGASRHWCDLPTLSDLR